MSIFSKLFGFVSKEGGDIITSVTDVVDRFVTTKEEKEKIKQELLKLQEESRENQRTFKLEMERLVQLRESEIEKTIRAELDTTKEIVVAELNQGDNYTKRARPTVVYAGLIFILLELFGLRIYMVNSIDSSMVSNSNEIFKYFLLSWSGVVGVYSVGRTAEKRGIRNAWTSAITGGENQNTNQNTNTSILMEGRVKKITSQISGIWN